MRGEFIIAVHALIYLNHKNRMVTSSELADNICSPPARIRKVMLILKKHGLVDTAPGAKGGYFLKKPAEEISLADCLAVLEDKAVTVNWLSGDKEKACLISSGMGDLILDIQQDLNLLCNNYLQNKSILALEKIIFKEEGK